MGSCACETDHFAHAWLHKHLVPGTIAVVTYVEGDPLWPARWDEEDSLACRVAAWDSWSYISDRGRPASALWFLYSTWAEVLPDDAFKEPDGADSFPDSYWSSDDLEMRAWIIPEIQERVATLPIRGCFSTSTAPITVPMD